jgi:hypothetical protein
MGLVRNKTDIALICISRFTQNNHHEYTRLTIGKIYKAVLYEDSSGFYYLVSDDEDTPLTFFLSSSLQDSLFSDLFIPLEEYREEKLIKLGVDGEN